MLQKQNKFLRTVCLRHSGFKPIERSLRMDAELWFRDWSVMHEGFPDNYLVLDIETTGNDLSKDVILEIGWCEVKDNKVITNNSVILDWERTPYVDPKWVKQRLKETKQRMEEEGKCFPFSVDSLSSGVKPNNFFSLLLDKLKQVRHQDGVVVTHNGVRFDLPIISSHFHRVLNTNYRFLPEEIWDTGALEKGHQLDELLCQGELPGDFAYRVLNRSNDKIKWNLHDHVIYKYDLANRFDLNLELAHTARYDAYITYLLFNEFRQLSERGLKRQPVCIRSLV